MNATTAVIGGLVVLVLIGGLIFFSTGNINPFSPTATSTPSGSTNTNQTNTPGAPIALTSGTAFPSDTAAVVSGTVTPNGAFTNYWYEFGTTASLGNKTSNQSVGSGYIPIPAPAYITGLAKDTTYYFRLVAENQFGTIAGSQQTFHTTVGTPAPVGSAPTTKTLAATGISRTTVNINGEVTPNKSSTQYWFEYGETPNLGFATALQSVGDGTALVPASLSLSNLAPATTHYFRLNAQNQFGTVNGAILNFKTLGPPLSVAPVVTTQIASPVATTTATLRGTVHPYGTQTTYWFEYSTDSLLGAVLMKTTPQRSAGAGTNTVSVEANISALKSKTTYYYRTVAQNAAGTVRGEDESFTTK
ncbi:MAG: fibronectin type III domain-containing protein [Parcubacteria group bacterium Gr01-1014_56]|nr:MAG: fibronectin type III domain-containing protein [Parcubacteria group bacterium Gr01-1014_56]